MFLRVLVVISLLFLLSCSSSSSSEKNKPDDLNEQQTEIPVIENIKFILDKTIVANDEYIEIIVHAMFSDGSVKDISRNSSLDLSTNEGGSILTFPCFCFRQYKPGMLVIEASYKGFYAHEKLQVYEYVTRYDLNPNASILPLFSNVPVLSWAWAYYSTAEHVVDVFNTIDYSSSDESVAVFEPKVDKVVLNPYKDTNIGHLSTLATGTSTLTFSLPEASYEMDIEVLPHRLISTSRTTELLNRMLDTKIDSKGNSYFLSGDVQNIVVSEYSSTDHRWLEDIKINISNQVGGYMFAQLFVEPDRFIITWKHAGSAQVVIYDRTHGTYEISVLGTSTHGNEYIPDAVVDNEGRLIICWGDGPDFGWCKIKTHNEGWTEAQSFPYISGQLQLTSDNEGFFVHFSGEENERKLFVLKFKVTDTGIEELSNTDIPLDSQLEFIPNECKGLDVSKSGHMVCILLDREHAIRDGALYTLSYHTDTKWELEKHFEKGDYELSWAQESNVGIDDVGNILFTFGERENFNIYEKTYTHPIGWSNPILITNTYPRRAFISHKPVKTDEGWKLFIDHNRSLYRKLNGAWNGPKLIREFMHWGITNYPYGHIDISSNGKISLAWEESWGYGTSDGGYAFNDLYMMSPAQ